jgi:hypothetical protein
MPEGRDTLKYASDSTLEKLAEAGNKVAILLLKERREFAREVRRIERLEKETK